jgi:hypothetical protein
MDRQMDTILLFAIQMSKYTTSFILKVHIQAAIFGSVLHMELLCHMPTLLPCNIYEAVSTFCVHIMVLTKFQNGGPPRGL